MNDLVVVCKFSVIFCTKTNYILLKKKTNEGCKKIGLIRQVQVLRNFQVDNAQLIKQKEASE
jgi:hypothetical protein